MDHPYPIPPSWNSSLGWVWDCDKVVLGSHPPTLAAKLGLEFARSGVFLADDDKLAISKNWFNAAGLEVAQYQYGTRWLVILHEPRVWGAPALQWDQPRA